MSGGDESALEVAAVVDSAALERAAVAIARERDGFAALLGRFARSLARDLTRGAVTADFVVDLERRIGTMTEQVGLGLHIVGTRPLDDPDAASPDAPVVEGGR